MAALNQTLSVNGQKLSNNDPDLVITLDDHSVVQISKIEESTITYSFTGSTDQEKTYNLNLTFVYKETHKLVVPMTFIHKASTLTIVIAPTDFFGGDGSIVQLRGQIYDNGKYTDLSASGVVLSLSDNDLIQIVPGSAGPNWVNVEFIKDAETDETATVDFIASRNGLSAVQQLAVRLTPPITSIGSELISPDTMTNNDSNTARFKLIDNNGNPAGGFIGSTITWESDPPGKGAVTNSNNILNELDFDQAIYSNGINTGYLPAKITLKELTGTYKGKPYTVPFGFEWVIPGAPLVIVIDPVSVGGDNNELTTVTVNVQQKRGPSNILIPNLTIQNLESGDEDLVEIVGEPTIVSDGIFSFVVKAKGSAGQVSIAFDAYDSGVLAGSGIFDINVEEPGVPVVNSGTTKLAMNLWERKAIPLTVTLEGTDITSDITNIVSTNSGDIGDKFEFVKLSDASWGYQSVKSETYKETLAVGEFDVYLTHQGTDYIVKGSVNLATNINNGEIPTNRFNVEFV